MRGTYCQFRFIRFLGIRLNKYVALKWTKFLKAGLHVFDPLCSVKRLSFIYMYCQWDRDTDISGYFPGCKMFVK